MDLEEVTIAELQARLASGEVSARQLVEAYVSRIETLDRSGPTLRSIIELNPAVLEIADELDQERAGGHVRGQLHGIPIVLKDNIDTADRMQTTAGSLALLDAPVAVDAPVARKLRDAGAVLLGKTSPEELLAASHASCYAMALSAGLARAGSAPQSLEVSSTVTFDKVGEGFKVVSSALEVRGRVANMDEDTFVKAAEAAKDGCPISQALKGNVDLSVKATLVPS